MTRSLLCLLLAFGSSLVLKSEEPFDPQRLEKLVVVPACNDPMQLQVLEDGRVLFIERAGAIKIAGDPHSPVSQVGTIPVAVFGEVGLLGLQCDPGFAENGWIYLFFCPQERPQTMRLSRFTLREDRIVEDSEIEMLSYPIDAEGAIHMGGGMCMDARGNLLIGTGDNCPPIPELPIDFRSGRENFDALRTAGNSMDLRGKILRITPQPDGGYTIPAGNLFADADQGRPEIFAMGCRNPFRISVDPSTRAAMWGDVGPNIQEDLGIGPNGYDEFNRTTSAGNFGWPMFVGPNEAYRRFDFATRSPGEPFSLEAPRNDSPNNTGLVALPPPKPALIWYPSRSSREFPSMGSGGRSAMSGPVYSPIETQGDARSESGLIDPSLRLHSRFLGRWFIFEWTRNWIQTVSFDRTGQLVETEPFMPETTFRKPIDLQFGPDGTLYVVEYGDTWGNNQDSQISRIVYRRGNRTPRAVIKATPQAGRHPLVVQVDAGASSDPDGDQLNYQWELNGEPLPGMQSAQGELTVTTPGVHRLVGKVADADGALASDELELRVGNSPPMVRITSPRHGSFFDWGDTIRYRVSAEDAEDGSTASGTIERGRVLLSHRVATRRFSEADDRDPGLRLMRRTTCFSCHTTKAASAGPPYHEVARRYDQTPEVLDKLAAKVISGGTGVWGNKPMPPHPQHTLEETRQMVRWILALRDDGSTAPVPGTHGFFRAEKGDLNDPSALVLTAEYIDNGAAADPASQSATVPPIRGEDVCVLHSRRKRAAFADRAHGVDLVDVFEGGAGLVSRLGPGDWFSFHDVLLDDIDRITIDLAAPEAFRGTLSLRIGSPQGPELAHVTVTGKSDRHGPVFHQRNVGISPSPETGVCNLYVVHDGQVSAGQTAVDNDDEAMSAQSDASMSVAWMEFHLSQEAKRRKAKEEASVKRILLVPTKLDHAWATHMYTDVCRLLAETLNQTPGVEAIVSPDLDWPTDAGLLEQIDGLVYYSRPAGDILLSPQHRAAAEALMSRGVGLTAIHWSTGAELDVGPQYERILGGWFNFDFSGLAVDRKRLQQVEPNHPICRGWSEYDLRDEFYLNLKFHPEAIPVLKVNVDGQDQTVAWTLRREDGGRSFGTTLGHFHDNFSLPDFRRMIANGILWTAGLDIPEAGAPVEIDPDWLKLEDPNPPTDRQWTYDQLRGALELAGRQGKVERSFARGEQLFSQASCVSCHDIGKTPDTQTEKLGPNLAALQSRMAAEDDPRGYLLREIVQPSHRIEDSFRSQILLLDDGQIVHGMVRAHKNGELVVAVDPTKPDQRLQIHEDQIESRRASETSMMPAGLLNPLDEHEILDLLAYVESNANPNYVAFRRPAIPIEPWADPNLPVTEGLRFWLDASRINSARRSVGLPETRHGERLDVWPDASGYRLLARQRQAASQPVLRMEPDGNFVEFDGIDDYLLASETGLRTNQFTVSVVFRPDHNRGWPGILSANAIGRNDYQSGFNIDLMHRPTDRFETVMTEGTGYPGVVDLMTESHEFGQFFILTVRSRPAQDGVVLRINGREQAARQRTDALIDCQELTVGSRYWSNDVGVPPHNRGFLAGAVAQVLFYDRALSEAELVANEVYLWESNESLLDPQRR